MKVTFVSMNTDVTATSLPLAGLRVLELGHIVAGPTAGQILADLGADVLKVESVDGGDQMRRMPPAGAAAFHFFNRNKRSIALDLRGGGKEAFLRLAGQADIILDNFAFGAVEKLGIDHDVVARENPRVIWLAIKGFLPGPAERRPMLDELAQMMGGLAFMTGPAGQPMRAGASVIDVGAATYGVLGVLAALRQRDATGRGQRITAGLFETSVFWVGQWMASSQQQQKPSVPMAEIRQGSRMGWGVYQLFRTRDDDQVFIGITSDAHWSRFCKAFERPDLLADPRFKDNTARVVAHQELAQIIGAMVDALDSSVVQARLEAAGVPFAPLRRPDQLVNEPQLTESGHLLETPVDGERSSWLPKLPLHSDAFAFGLRRLAPRLGEQTVEALQEAGYTQAEIRAMIDSGAVLDGSATGKH